MLKVNTKWILLQVVLDNCQKDSKTDEKTGGCKVRNSYVSISLYCKYWYNDIQKILIKYE